MCWNFPIENCQWLVQAMMAAHLAAMPKTRFPACFYKLQILLQVQHMSKTPADQQYKGLMDAFRRIPARQGGWKVTLHKTSAQSKSMPDCQTWKSLRQTVSLPVLCQSVSITCLSW
jgi:hypothetical protein